MVTVCICSKLKTSWKLIVFTNKVRKNSWYFEGIFYKTIIPLALFGYEMIVANSHPTHKCGIIVNWYGIALHMGYKPEPHWYKGGALSIVPSIYLSPCSNYYTVSVFFVTRIFHPGVHRTHREAKRGSWGRKAGHNFLDTAGADYPIRVIGSWIQLIQRLQVWVRENTSYFLRWYISTFYIQLTQQLNVLWLWVRVKMP